MREEILIVEGVGGGLDDRGRDAGGAGGRGYWRGDRGGRQDINNWTLGAQAATIEFREIEELHYCIISVPLLVSSPLHTGPRLPDRYSYS